MGLTCEFSRKVAWAALPCCQCTVALVQGPCTHQLSMLYEKLLEMASLFEDDIESLTIFSL